MGTFDLERPQQHQKLFMKFLDKINFFNFIFIENIKIVQIKFKGQIYLFIMIGRFLVTLFINVQINLL